MEFNEKSLPNASLLEVHSARLNIHLGCSEAERALPQEVDLRIQVRFNVVPPACQTDELQDTVCYQQILTSLRGYLFERRYALIEKLAAEVFLYFQERLPSQTELAIRIHKLYPPVEKMPGGVSFQLGEFR